MSVGSCPYGGQWWSCPDQYPSFAGCCSTFPCQGDYTGCPDDDLYPVVYASSSASGTATTSSSSGSSTSQSLTTSTSSSSTSSSSASSSSASSSQMSSSTTTISSSQTSSFTTSRSSSLATAGADTLISFPTSSPTPTPTPSSSPSSSRSLSKTQIIGGSVGGAVLILLLCALFLSWYWSKRSRRSHKCQSLLRHTHSSSPFPPEMSGRESLQSSQRTSLQYLQTDVSNTPQRQRTPSTYSALSTNPVTPSHVDSLYSSGEQLVGSEDARTRPSEQAYLLGQPGLPEAIVQPRRNLPSEQRRPSPEAVAQRRRSPLSQCQIPGSPPASVSHQHSPTSPISPPTPEVIVDPRRAIHDQSSTHPEKTGNQVLAAAGAPNGEQGSSAGQYESRCQPQLTVLTMQPDRGLGLNDPRWRGEIAPLEYIYETPDSIGDRVPELPFSTKAGISQRPMKASSLRVTTVSGSAVGPSAVQGGSRWGPANEGPTVESINAAGASPGKWDGDLRTSSEKERDLLREKERQRVARTSYTHLQVVNP